MHVAQTNLQLYNQLRRQNWPDGELRRVHAAYQLAISVFAGHFRPNQKPFLAHLVGVASILAECQATPTIVIVGLLHSAYSHGEFGDGLRGASPRKRRLVRQVVGSECETLIEAYATRSCGLQHFAELTAANSQLDSFDEAIVLVKLADLVEDHLDDGAHYSPRKSLGQRREDESLWRVAMALAARLERFSLTDQLRAAMVASSTASVPDFLQTALPGSYLIAPKSHQRRASVQLGRIVHRLRAKLARFSFAAGGRAA